MASRPPRPARRSLHIHVRDPATGAAVDGRSSSIARSSSASARADRELIINLTTGPGRPLHPQRRRPERRRARHARCCRRSSAGRAHRGAAARHLLARPQHDGLGRRGRDQHAAQRAHAWRRRSARPACCPSSRCSTRGDIHLAHELIADGTLQRPRPVLDRHAASRYGFARQPGDAALRARPAAGRCACGPPSASAATSSRCVALAWLAGGHVRVGLEDNIYLDTRRARADQRRAGRARRAASSSDLGGELANPREARRLLGLPPSTKPEPEHRHARN